MKIMEYTSVSNLTSDNVLLIDGASGTKKILVSDAIIAMLDLLSVKNKRMIFRGKNLGTSFTTEQKTAVQNGTFKGLCLGDYWVINNVNWRIVDFDYWYNRGNPKFTNHHLVIMPDTALTSGEMNDSSLTTGGYTGSKMYTTTLASVKSTIANAFGDAVLTHKEYLIDSVTNGYPATGAFVDSSVELPNEIMIYGSYIYTPSGDGSVDVKRFTISNYQLALMAVNPDFILASSGYWLRDVASATAFCRVDSTGGAQATNAANSLGIRPVFPIG